MCPSCRTAARQECQVLLQLRQRTVWLRRCPPPSSAGVLVPSKDAFCPHKLGPGCKVGLSCSLWATICRCVARCMSGCLVMHKRMTPLAGAVNWSSSAWRIWRHCATGHSGRQAKHASKQAAVHAGLPASDTVTAQTRIVVGGACMRDQMIFRAVHLDQVQTFSRCRGRRFEQPSRASHPLMTGGNRGSDPPGHMPGLRVGPSWHGAEFTR